MLLWSYLAAVMTEPGFVPEAWHPFADDEVSGGSSGFGW